MKDTWLKFWHTKWFVKWPILVFAGFIVIGIIGSATGSGDDTKDNKASSDVVASSPAAADEKATNTPKPSNTPKPTDTPKPTATPLPPTATPAPPGFTFGSGKKQVGAEVVAGATYRAKDATKGCYWERLSGLGGTLAEILANDNADGPAIVTIGAGDVAFNSTRCGNWSQDLSPVTTDPNAPFKAGTFLVGVDISAGLWKSDGTGNCYWERERAFDGKISSIVANDNATGSTLVQIAATDKAFKSSAGCGTWTKQ